ALPERRVRVKRGLRFAPESRIGLSRYQCIMAVSGKRAGHICAQNRRARGEVADQYADRCHWADFILAVSLALAGIRISELSRGGDNSLAGRYHRHRIDRDICPFM